MDLRAAVRDNLDDDLLTKTGDEGLLAERAVISHRPGQPDRRQRLRASTSACFTPPWTGCTPATCPRCRSAGHDSQTLMPTWAHRPAHQRQRLRRMRRHRRVGRLMVDVRNDSQRNQLAWTPWCWHQEPAERQSWPCSAGESAIDRPLHPRRRRRNADSIVFQMFGLTWPCCSNPLPTIVSAPDVSIG